MQGTGFNGSYNIPPTSTGVIIYVNRDNDNTYEYVAEPLRFGVLPEWAKPKDLLPVKKGSGLGASYSREVQAQQAKLFNCRRETLSQPKSVWTQPRAHKRCVVPITGYFEWLTTKSGEKTPYYVHSDKPLLFLAGLYAHNTNYNETDLVSHSQEYFSSFSIVTGPATGEDKNDLKWLHSRKPIFIKEFSKEWYLWLDPKGGWDDSLLECLNTDTNPVYEGLKWHIVSSTVGNPKNHSQEVIKEVKVKQKSISSFFSPKKRTAAPKEESEGNVKGEGVKKEEKKDTMNIMNFVSNTKSRRTDNMDGELGDSSLPIAKRVKLEHQGSETAFREDLDDADEEDI